MAGQSLQACWRRQRPDRRKRAPALACHTVGDLGVTRHELGMQRAARSLERRRVGTPGFCPSTAVGTAAKPSPTRAPSPVPPPGYPLSRPRDAVSSRAARVAARCEPHTVLVWPAQHGTAVAELHARRRARPAVCTAPQHTTRGHPSGCQAGHSRQVRDAAAASSHAHVRTSFHRRAPVRALHMHWIREPRVVAVHPEPRANRAAMAPAMSRIMRMPRQSCRS